MSKAKWSFIRRRPSSGKARNSQVEKFFRSAEVENRANAVVREGIQNSLDAFLKQETGCKSVNIAITFGECDATSALEFFPGLLDHVSATLDNPPSLDEPIPFLTFEDFNTTGLSGDTNAWDPPDNKNAFFNFFRGEGVTDKEGSQRGRHGVGKMVFSIASRSMSLFGLTSTSGGGPHLMGASTLRLHKLNGQSYDPDGWFGLQTLVDGDELTVPVEDPAMLARFNNCFRLQRSGEIAKSPGLSVVIPWLHESVNSVETITAVIKGYYWPILNKQLYVDIVNKDPPTLKIFSDSIMQVAKEHCESHENCSVDYGTLELAQWALNQSVFVCAKLPGERAQNWDSSLLEDTDKKQLRETLEQEKPVAIELPIQIRHKETKATEESSFHVFIQPDSNCADGNIQFIREGLLISGVRTRRHPSRHRALVVIDEGPLATFLGDSENPSHTVWEAATVKEKYSYHASCIKYVVNAVSNILAALHDGESTADKTLLLDLFSLPDEENNLPPKPARKKKKKGPGDTDPEKLKIKGTRKKSYDISQHHDGFIIKQSANPSPRLKAINLQLAYAVRKGKPLKKYSETDFNLQGKQLKINVEGGIIENRHNNQLRVTDLKEQFKIEVTGFDPNRDLYINDKAEIESAEVHDAEND